MSRMIIGLDIGGTKTAVVEGSAQAEILQREEIATEASRPFDETFPRITELIKKTIDAARQSNREAIAISVSIGGPLKIAEGVLIDPPHLPGWRGVRLKERLMDEFPDLPVFVEHDGAAGALAEFHFGVGKGRDDLRHLVFLTFGTGVIRQGGFVGGLRFRRGDGRVGLSNVSRPVGDRDADS
jgi:glucokinase